METEWQHYLRQCIDTIVSIAEGRPFQVFEQVVSLMSLLTWSLRVMPLNWLLINCLLKSDTLTKKITKFSKESFHKIPFSAFTVQRLASTIRTIHDIGKVTRRSPIDGGRLQQMPSHTLCYT